jgi:iron complex outermembrane receptor protein
MEASLQYVMRPWGRWSVSPFLSYTLNDHNFVDFKTEDADFSGNPLTGVPKHRIYGGLQISSGRGLFWNTNYQYVDPIPLTDGTSLYSDAYNLVNTQFGYRTQWGTRLNLSLETGINNLFDTRYASSVLINATGFGGAEPRYYYPGNGRNYYVGLLLLYSL